MKLLPRPERLIEQEDFEAMSAYHEDSLQRHQRTTESKKQFRSGSSVAEERPS